MPRAGGALSGRRAFPQPGGDGDATASGAASTSTLRYPLPELIAELRAALYARLRRCRQSLERGAWASTSAIPADHEHSCSAAMPPDRPGRRRCCCKYGDGDYNCLHQDLYGEHVFPLQVAILLSEPGRDFTGGEFVLTEQRPRMQSRAEVVPLAQGDAVVFRCASPAGAGDARRLSR